MIPEQKNMYQESSDNTVYINNLIADTINLNNLKQRALLLKKVREFFEVRDVLEVETPIIARAPAVCPYIDSLSTNVNIRGKNQEFFLQTSPEFAMKRLLAMGSSSIYQICKAFRNNEEGNYHNIEFTILEWYRVGFLLEDLMDEVDKLLQYTIKSKPARYFTYHDLFIRYLNVNPFRANFEELKDVFLAKGGNIDLTKIDKDDILDLLLDMYIIPKLVFDEPLILYDYPSSKSALSKVVRASYMEDDVAKRFEVYYKGIELANGFYELTCPKEQLKRFKKNNIQRQKIGSRQVPIDMRLINCLDKIPDTSGVALGFDRLLMLLVNTSNIDDVISFVTENA